MLVMSLICSLALLVTANWAVYHQAFRLPALLAFSLCGVAFSIGPLLGGLFFLPPVAMLFVCLLVALLVWHACQRRRWLFSVLSAVATVAVFGIAGWSAWKDEQELARLRSEFPYQSLEERLPVPPLTSRQGRLADNAAERLDCLERSLADKEGTFRGDLLWLLHEDTLRLFVNSPGFGIARMRRPYQQGLTSGLRHGEPIPQPDLDRRSLWSLEELTWRPRAASDGLHLLHQWSIEDFLNPKGFGYVRDRRHVAGFQAHQLSGMPGPAEQWEVRHLDLVSLLLHDQPVAYVSAHLPRMDELREAPTRPLDSFEAAALEPLRGGEDLVVGGTPEGLRMLGGIRSTKQCLQCHGGERGDLLGAFSYALRRSKE